MLMRKSDITSAIIEQLQQELSMAITATENAHQAATDDQSVAETQYDTLAIEAGYLAHGQAQRVDDINQALIAFQNLEKTLSDTNQVVIGTLVQLEGNISNNQYFFIAPAAGGYRCEVSIENTRNSITVITPYSPMGKALMGKVCDDEIELTVGHTTTTDFISLVR